MWFNSSLTYTSNKVLREFIATNMKKGEPLKYTDLPESFVPAALESVLYTGLFISPSGISELDCATTKTDTAERSISIDREYLQVFFVLGALACFQVPPLGGSREEKWRSQSIRKRSVSWNLPKLSQL